MVTPLPVNEDQIVQAAKEMIAEHGLSAISAAQQRVSVCKSEGFHSVAETWQLIREVIRDMQESDAEKCQAFESKK